MYSLLNDILIFTLAAVIIVPLFRLVKLGAILAYLFAGILIGPDFLKLVENPQSILHFSELGIVFLLFIIGLELAPAKLWKLRGTIFGLGLFQVMITGIVLTLVGLGLGFSMTISYIAGFSLALSSTAFVIPLLEENRQLNTTYGQGSFSILMFQDLAVVPLIASLAFFEINSKVSFSILKLFESIILIIVVIILGHLLIRRVFKLILDTKTQEVFTAFALFLVIGSAIGMEKAGFSMGMGAFLAGVLLANSEYRHELESNLIPFKGLLLGLFFIAVGMSLDLHVLLANFHIVLLITCSFMLIKGLVIYSFARIFKFSKEPSRNMSFILAQGGEFAFVMFAAASDKNFLSAQEASILNASVTISMILTPFLFSFNQRYLKKVSEISESPFDSIDSEEPEVIIAGFGRFGQIVARILNSQNIKFTILDHSAAQVDNARKFGSKVYYGDASRADILESAGIKSAKVFVLAIDDPESSKKTANLIKKKYNYLQIIARVRNREHAMDLINLGITNVHRETYLTSLEVAKEVLLFKGIERNIINKRLAKFRTNDEEILKEQASHRGDEEKFLSFTLQANKLLDEIIKADKQDH